MIATTTPPTTAPTRMTVSDDKSCALDDSSDSGIVDVSLGWDDGWPVDTAEGLFVGFLEGTFNCFSEGCKVGWAVGCLVGWQVGVVGWPVGCLVGWLVGCPVGCPVGWQLGAVGWPVGCLVGSLVGCPVGWQVGAVGWPVGCAVGRSVGCPEGWPLGFRVGWPVGCAVGRSVGWLLGASVRYPVYSPNWNSPLEVRNGVSCNLRPVKPPSCCTIAWPTSIMYSKGLSMPKNFFIWRKSVFVRSSRDLARFD
jgi:hypothetical protein